MGEYGGNGRGVKAVTSSGSVLRDLITSTVSSVVGDDAAASNVVIPSGINDSDWQKRALANLEASRIADMPVAMLNGAKLKGMSVQPFPPPPSPF